MYSVNQTDAPLNLKQVTMRLKFPQFGDIEIGGDIDKSTLIRVNEVFPKSKQGVMRIESIELRMDEKGLYKEVWLEI